MNAVQTSHSPAPVGTLALSIDGAIELIDTTDTDAVRIAIGKLGWTDNPARRPAMAVTP